MGREICPNVLFCLKRETAHDSNGPAETKSCFTKYTVKVWNNQEQNEQGVIAL